LKNWYGNCPNKAEDCTYGHGKSDLCPFLVRDGKCAHVQSKCKLVHVDPRAKTVSVKPRDIGQAILERVAEMTAEKEDVEAPTSKTSDAKPLSTLVAEYSVPSEASSIKKELPMQLALDVFTYGRLRGDALVERIKGLTEDIPVNDFLDLMLQDQNREKLSLGWYSDAQFGAILRYWAAKSELHQIAMLDGVLKYCCDEAFPSMLVKGVNRSYVELVFLLLRVNDIVQDSSFLSWADRTDGNDDDSKGKHKALVQLTSFLMALRENEIQDEEDEELEEEMTDEGTSEPVDLSPIQTAVIAKEQTKAAKKERRAAKLEERGAVSYPRATTAC
jgi:hypothetical protein